MGEPERSDYIFVSLHFLILVNNWLNLFEHAPDLCSLQLSDGEKVTAEKVDDGGSEKAPKASVPLSDKGVSKSSAGKMMHQTV